MAVRCEGDSRVMEQIGEKQDFEAELSRLGFAHEAFMLYVRRANASASDRNWSTSYAVCVTNTDTKRQNIYWGGPGKNWVCDFLADANGGLFGPPNFGAAARRATGGLNRPRLVVGGAKRP